MATRRICSFLHKNPIPIDSKPQDHYLRSMKTLKASLMIVLLAVLAVGCTSSTDKILPKKGGTWKTTSIEIRSYVNSALVSTTNDTRTYNYFFEKTGAGTFTDSAGTRTITWLVNPSGEIMNTCFNTATSQVCDQYLILESTKDSQKWLQTIIGTNNGDKTEREVTLARVE